MIECMNDRKAFMDVGYVLEIRARLVSHTIIKMLKKPGI